jgi:hypothetical protein
VIVEPETGKAVVASEAWDACLFRLIRMSIHEFVSLCPYYNTKAKQASNPALKYIFVIAYGILRTDACGGQPSGIGLSPLQLN